ncbi:MAG: glycosyltransferase family 2 protein [Defluviimonas denitrificans]
MVLPRWGIVTTADAPVSLLIAHAAHHLAAGAGEVHLYLDSAPAPAEDLAPLQRLPGVRVTVADRAWWRGQGRRRPRLHQVRQTHNATAALAATDMDYLIHLDIDEFLWQWEPLAEELSLLPEGHFLKIGNIERVHAATDPGTDIFSPLFRLPEALVSGREAAEEDLRNGGLTRQGLTGHSSGKAASPAGLGYTAGIHRPRLSARRGGLYPRHRLSESATILHFDGVTPLDWLHKLLRKGEALERDPQSPAAEERARQVAALMACGPDLAAALALYDRLKRLDPAREATWRGDGRVIEVPFDPAGAIAELLPGHAADLSRDGYDRWLAAAKGDVFARFGMPVGG